MFLEYLALVRRVPRAMQQACFPSVQLIAHMACMFCLAPASAALFGVGRQGGFSSLSLPEMSGTVGICPNECFRTCPPFVYVLLNCHAFEDAACSFVGLNFRIPALYIGLFCPAVWNGVK